MKFSEQWLREWADPQLSTAELAEQLTMAGLEVEVIEPVAPEFSNLVVGKILTVEKHPDANKLQVCMVDVGELSPEPLQIVCGAPNARKDLRVACAMIDAVLPGNFKIKKSKLRGVVSLGMLCSEKELGLSESAEGIMELPLDAPVGSTLKDYLMLEDVSIELDLTPNRGDCLSVAGVAREVGVLNRIDVQPVEINQQQASIESSIKINIAAARACPRYAGRVIRNVNTGAQTPLWMQEKLRRSGNRSISPLVDITNYVMLELGQPMHAFDLDKISGGINVRMATEGEKLTLLDGVEISLGADNLVIADDTQALALAGIMGGESSAVTEATSDILLESAFFAPDAIIGKARALGLHTDSSHRFERGVSYCLQVQALERATRLVLEIAGGEAGPVLEQVHSDMLPEPRTIVLKKEKMLRVLGIEVDAQVVKDVLTRLEMDVIDFDDGWQVTPPAFRFDIEFDVDLIEEIGRIYGYDRLPVTQPHGAIAMAACPEEQLDEIRIKNCLVDLGYQEAITYSFIEPGIQKLITPATEAMRLSNPISDELSVMRTSLWPGLIQALVYNQNRQQNRIRLFEVGSCFIPVTDGLQQEVMVAGIINGSVFPEQWGEKIRAVDFYDLKADLEALLSLGGNLSGYKFTAAEHAALHPGQSARIYKDNQAVGWIGKLHPSVAKVTDVKSHAILFEVKLSAISTAKVPKFKVLSKYPAIRRDIAIIVDEGVPASAIIDSISETASGALSEDTQVNVQLFDLYTGEGIAPDRKSLALGLTLQQQSRTLKDEEVDSLIQKVLNDLEQHYAAKLRD